MSESRALRALEKENDKLRELIKELEKDFAHEVDIASQANVMCIKQAERIKELEAIPRCPCGGELEGLGYDRRAKEVVFECKKCHAQILLQKDVWEQALKGG